MMSLLKSPWLASLFGGVLYLVTTVAALDPSHFAGLRVTEAVPSAPGDDPSWRFRNPEFEQWLQELKVEKEALALREQQLRELQTRVEAERAEIFAVTQTVSQLQKEFDQNIVRFKQQESENLKRQTKVISGMTPDGAARMLKEMQDEEIVRILFTMKADEASAILDTLSKLGSAEAKRAASVTERMRKALPADPKARAGP